MNDTDTSISHILYPIKSHLLHPTTQERNSDLQTHSLHRESWANKTEKHKGEGEDFYLIYVKPFVITILSSSTSFSTFYFEWRNVFNKRMHFVLVPVYGSVCFT